MSGNTFQVAAIWGLRNESVADLADGALKTMDALTAICPFCERWSIPDHSKPRYGLENMLIRSVPLTRVRNRLTDFVGYGVSRDDYGQPDPGGGYSLTTGNEQEIPSRYVSMGCHGAYANPGTRTSAASFGTSYSTTPDPAIAAYPVIRSIIQAYVQIWKPDYAIATTSDLIEYERDRRVVFEVSWMTYLSRPLAKRIDRTDNIPVVQVAEGGLFLIAAEETFDAINPAHLDGARAIREAVAPLNR